MRASTCLYQHLLDSRTLDARDNGITAQLSKHELKEREQQKLGGGGGMEAKGLWEKVCVSAKRQQNRTNLFALPPGGLLLAIKHAGTAIGARRPHISAGCRRSIGVVLWPRGS